MGVTPAALASVQFLYLTAGGFINVPFAVCEGVGAGVELAVVF